MHVLCMSANHTMTCSGSPPVQLAMEWLEENDLIQRLLRANLHQRQYVEQVSSARACVVALLFPLLFCD